MADAALFKRWKVSEAFLLRAHEALPRPADEESYRSLGKAFFDHIDRNEHELALDTLQELGELTQPRGGFWEDLVRAAENMELPQRVPYFEKKYGEALSRFGNDRGNA